jgi:hypothetical protein
MTAGSSKKCSRISYLVSTRAVVLVSDYWPLLIFGQSQYGWVKVDPDSLSAMTTMGSIRATKQCLSHQATFGFESPLWVRRMPRYPLDTRPFRLSFPQAAGTAKHLHGASPPDGVKRHLRVGASPRGIQAMIWAGKVEALLNNRKAVAIDDIRKVAYPALCHRLLLTYEAQAEGVSPDEIVAEVIKVVKVPKE